MKPEINALNYAVGGTDTWLLPNGPIDLRTPSAALQRRNLSAKQASAR
jgi:hypothetical protein